MAQGGGTQGGFPSYRFRRLAADPVTCTTGDVYFNYVTPAYRKCQTTNTWTDFSFSGGAFTSPLLGPNGTAALPTYSFSSDPNTGMFRSGADAIGFSTGGTERWVINSSGALNPFVDNTYDIGNGSVNPRDVNISRKLIVGKAATNTGQIDFTGTTSGVVSVKPADAAGTWTLTLPANDGDASQYLQTNGSGVTSWQTVAGGDVVGPASATDNAVVRFDSTTGKLVQNSLTHLSDTGGLNLGSVSAHAYGLRVSNAVTDIATNGIHVNTITTLTGTSPNNIYGAYVQPVVMGTGTMGTLDLYGMALVPYGDTDGNFDSIIGLAAWPEKVKATSVASLQGIQIQTALSAGTATDIIDLYALGSYMAPGTSATTRYGVRINQPDSAGATLTNNYGLHIADHSNGTNDWNIFSAGAASRNVFQGELQLGGAAVATGQLKFNGTTSGTVTVKPADAAGTWSMTLPANDGDASQYLQTNGAGLLSWQTVSAGITNAAGANVVPKSDGTNLVASTVTDDGTTVTATLGKVTAYDPTASTGVSTVSVRAGAGQSTTDLFSARDSTNARMGGFYLSGGLMYGQLTRISYVGSPSDFTTARINVDAATAILELGATGFIKWNSDTNIPYGTSDTGIKRLSAGVVETNSGTANTAGIFLTGAYRTRTNCADSAGAAACGASAAGAVVIDAAATTVVVSTTAVTANSRIFIEEDSSLATELGITCNTTIARTYAVTARTAATSFTITTSAAPITNPACLSYWIIN